MVKDLKKYRYIMTKWIEKLKIYIRILQQFNLKSMMIQQEKILKGKLGKLKK